MIDSLVAPESALQAPFHLFLQNLANAPMAMRSEEYRSGTVRATREYRQNEQDETRTMVLACCPRHLILEGGFSLTRKNETRLWLDL